MDNFGRVTIPGNMREVLAMCPGDTVELLQDGDGVYIKKAVDVCMVCGSSANLRYFYNRPFCPQCLRETQQSENMKNPR